MTYAEFLADCVRQQREYITCEFRRMGEAEALRTSWHQGAISTDAYRVSMAALHLHPLTYAEIKARKHEIGRMLAELNKHGGDTEAARAIYALQHKEPV